MRRSGEEIVHLSRSLNYKGFSLVEVLVSLLLLSLVLIPLFQMQQALNLSSTKLKKASQLIASSQTVLSFLNNLNPAEMPEGKQKLSGVELNWHSQRLESFMQPQSIDGKSREIILYEVTYSLQTAQGQKIESGKINKLGWISTP